MSNTYDTEDTDVGREEKRQALAEAFGRDLDPLAAHAATFEQMGLDPFDPFRFYIEDVIAPKDIVKNTKEQYKVLFRQWCAHMAEAGRHPACPNEGHVKVFAQRELDEKGNHPNTVKEKLRKLNSAYEYWQRQREFPHTTDYNPMEAARKKLDFTPPEQKDPPRISIDELSERVQTVPTLRAQAILVLQLKLGLRASELCNIQFAEVSLQNAAVREHYTEMGTHPMVADRPNAVYIPHDREGNKSKRPRVLPLDDEIRRVLVRYLLVRPDNGEPWVFLSDTHHEKLGQQGVNQTWKEAFHPEYTETKRHRSVTSHYGRHRFTTFWRVEKDINRELVKYLRGDTTSGAVLDGPPEAMDTYIHTYYEDIESLYREQIFKLGV